MAGFPILFLRAAAFVCLLGIVTGARSGPITDSFRIEIFAAHDGPVRQESVDIHGSSTAALSIQAYPLDGIAALEAKLSEGLPPEPETGKREALQRISELQRHDIEQVHRAATGLLRALELGLDRYPAIVFEGQAVVYGVTDLHEALRLYRAWAARAAE